MTPQKRPLQKLRHRSAASLSILRTCRDMPRSETQPRRRRTSRIRRAWSSVFPRLSARIPVGLSTRPPESATVMPDRLSASSVQALLDSYPRARPPLPAGNAGIYLDEYKINGGGRGAVVLRPHG